MKISAVEMANHIAARDAAPLLPDGVPGPVHYADQWWAVPQDQQEYQPIQDAAAIARFDDLARRYAEGVEAVQAERQEQGQ
uniref:hypothetical protein n=1 Tax=Amycolatopsis sp. CA-151526 TaxID=3239921 RepID=UPI003F497668